MTEYITQINGTWVLTNKGRIFERVKKFHTEQVGSPNSTGLSEQIVQDGYVWEEITLPSELQEPEKDD